MIIKTKNLVLRPYKKSDANSLLENFNSYEVTKYLCGSKYPYTLSDAKKWIRQCQNNAKKKPRKEIVFVIEKNKKFIGSITLKEIESHKAELGYWIGEKHWNQGIITEAIKVASDYSFKKLKLSKIYAYVFLKNKMSVKVLIKNKFKKEGLLRRHRVKNGKFVDMYLYAKLK